MESYLYLKAVTGNDKRRDRLSDNEDANYELLGFQLGLERLTYQEMVNAIRPIFTRNERGEEQTEKSGWFTFLVDDKVILRKELHTIPSGLNFGLSIKQVESFLGRSQVGLNLLSCKMKIEGSSFVEMRLQTRDEKPCPELEVRALFNLSDK